MQSDITVLWVYCFVSRLSRLSIQVQGDSRWTNTSFGELALLGYFFATSRTPNSSFNGTEFIQWQ